jgi:hypothetical protein
MLRLARIKKILMKYGDDVNLQVFVPRRAPHSGAAR